MDADPPLAETRALTADLVPARSRCALGGLQALPGTGVFPTIKQFAGMHIAFRAGFRGGMSRLRILVRHAPSPLRENRMKPRAVAIILLPALLLAAAVEVLP